MKGALLADPAGLLTSPGENSHSVRNLLFSDPAEVLEREKEIAALIREAIRVEEAGEKVTVLQQAESLPLELMAAFVRDPDFHAAFQALTLGRQRAYLLHFNKAKQSATRNSRIEQSRDRVLAGLGLQDCHCGLSQRMPRCDGSHRQLR